MQQLLAVKLGSIFGPRGGGSGETGKQVSTNKTLGDIWCTPMKCFADSTTDYPQDIRSLLNKLKNERNQPIAHRDGKIAGVTHDPDGSLTFRADPTSLTDDELVSLQKYIKACKYFCEQAQDHDDGPKLSEFTKVAWPNY